MRDGHIPCCSDVDLTSLLLVGRNTLAVHIRHQSPNSRWYSGAGIYRDVTLHVLPKRHIPLDGVYPRARQVPRTAADTESE